VAVEYEPSRSANVTEEPVGTVRTTSNPPVSPDAAVPVIVVDAAVPTTASWLAVPRPGADAAACAGTTDKSPNPSEATATADTFFNEIVFTIFLSFSQIKDDLLSGW
jgi:hypothetical protein